MGGRGRTAGHMPASKPYVHPHNVFTAMITTAASTTAVLFRSLSMRCCPPSVRSDLQRPHPLLRAVRVPPLATCVHEAWASSSTCPPNKHLPRGAQFGYAVNRGNGMTCACDGMRGGVGGLRLTTVLLTKWPDCRMYDSYNDRGQDMARAWSPMNTGGNYQVCICGCYLRCCVPSRFPTTSLRPQSDCHMLPCLRNRSIARFSLAQ
jgi:hypothetical protein